MAVEVPINFPERIKRLRVQFELTQTKLAELMSVSFASINRWENGQSRPSSLAWQRIESAEKHGIEALSGDFSVNYIQYDFPSNKREDIDSNLDFTSDPEIVKTVAEGERLTYGHLYNPAFATEISLIDPLPHQRIAVYEFMLKQPCLKFLLADDAGAGKTIMTGLYIREMLSRRLIQRVLIIPPAGLVGNWEREMNSLFRLSFKAITGIDARKSNPFMDSESNLLIVSVDTLAGERMFSRLQEHDTQPYDLVVFDEAHKLSAHQEPDFYVRKTERYRLAEALVGACTDEQQWGLAWSCHHLLLLTATPHMGKDFPYFCLWRLLEPEIFKTLDSFNAFPKTARSKYFIRRTKEEMVRYDGTPIYPTRISDTLSYELTQGKPSEQELYDKTTRYIQEYYNSCRLLNRSAARFAMSIFQRRLASSTYALLRSFERRLEKIEAIITDIKEGKISIEQLQRAQARLDELPDILDRKTADEEEIMDGLEEHEVNEHELLGGVVAISLAELEVEREQVKELLTLCQQVHDKGDESKFDKLNETIQDERFNHEKIIIFTEHKDTLEFLIRRFEGLGFTGQIAKIHGGMPYKERDEQVEFFRKSIDDGGAKYLVATDAAGEGINLQFCWLMINYDIPWNPARLEQRMGRIHRYGQKHDPVIIMNLIAGKTREGRVLKTLLDKLEKIRKELGNDKVFDVIGRLFEGLSLKEYMEEAVTEDGVNEVTRRIEGKLTKEQVEALHDKEKHFYESGGDVSKELPRLKDSIGHEAYCRLIPGYIQRFIEKAAPLLNLSIEGDLNKHFSFKPLKANAADFLWPLLDQYSETQRTRLSVNKPGDSQQAIFMHPGELVFDRFRDYFCQSFSHDALKGAVFLDSSVDEPYLFYLVLVSVERKADTDHSALKHSENLEYRLVGVKQFESGDFEECSVEYLLLLNGSESLPPAYRRLAVKASSLKATAQEYIIENICKPIAEKHRESMLNELPEKTEFIRRGYQYQESELAAARARLTEKLKSGVTGVKGELAKIKERQRNLTRQREKALNRIMREPELIEPGDIIFLAHALVIPLQDSEDIKRRDREIEEIAVKVARAYEESEDAVVKDVSKPELAQIAGLPEWPGFDLLSKRSDGKELAIEVKGRARIGEIELSENEWIKACNLRDRYWLYVVFECATSYPRLLRIRDPFGKLVVKAKGGVKIDEKEIFEAAE